MIRWALVLILAVVAGFAAWVRLAPVDVSRWHVAPPERPPGVYPGAGSHLVVRETTDPAALMAQIDAAARATSRTRVIAGSPEAGRVTYETRSALWGFPDYTTVAARGGTVAVFGRLRFGTGDMGVNRARIESWLPEP